MSHSDLRDFEAEYETEVVGLLVVVEKLGGGTVGKSYAGRWRYIVQRDGVEVVRGQDFDTGTLHTHAEVAAPLAEHCSQD